MSIADLLGDEKYVFIPKNVMANPGLSQSAKLLYGVLLDFCLRFDSDHVYPSQVALGREIGVASRQQVLKLTQELVSIRLVKVDHERVGSRTRIVYWLRSATVDASIRVAGDKRRQPYGDNGRQHESDRSKSDHRPSDEVGLAADDHARSAKAHSRAEGARGNLIAELYEEHYGNHWADVPSWAQKELLTATKGLNGEDGRAILGEALKDLSARTVDGANKPILDVVKYLTTALPGRLDPF